MILGGDIGGTKTALALARLVDGTPRIILERRYPSQEWGDFEALLRAFLDEADVGEDIASACFGVAGPVVDNRAKVTYLPWVIDGEALADTFDLGVAEVVNDFVAAAQGVATLQSGDLVTLQEGCPLEGSPRLLIGAGTGLGVAALIPQGNGWRTLGGEGGHIGFSPADEEQLIGLASSAPARRPHPGRVTAENVISGPGLVAIYDSLVKVSPQNTAIADPAEIVAAVPDNPLAARALDLFIAAYGAFAGDLALLFMARGGVYLGGGIAPKILPHLKDGGIVRAFHARGAHAGLMADFPIRVIVNERLGLLGALSIAAMHTKTLDSHQ